MPGHAAVWLRRLVVALACSLGGHADPQERAPLMSYVTLWDAQIAEWGFDKEPARLHRWLGDVRKAGIGHLVISVTWKDLEPDEGRFDFAAANRLVADICEADLRAVVVLDASGARAAGDLAPAWLSEKLGQESSQRLGGGPDGNACNLRETGPSFANPDVLALAQRFFRATVSELTSKARSGCIRSFSPNFNNELEARYIQHCDIFQDYNEHALDSYREWLLDQNGDASFWASRWDVKQPQSFWASMWGKKQQSKAGRSDELPPPPKVWGFSSETATDLAFWDWMRFREVLLARILGSSCDVIVDAGGGGCFLHFGEFFTTIDAINSVAFYELASHPSLIDIVLDTNFINFMGVTVEPIVASLLVSTAQPYAQADPKKRVWFEGAVERLVSGGRQGTGELRGDSLMSQGMQQALRAGAHGIGITNLLDVGLLPQILPVPLAEFANLRVEPWRPNVLLFTARETFYSFRKHTQKSDKQDFLQIRLIKAYQKIEARCSGCQVQLVGDARLLQNESFVRGFNRHTWLTLPGALPLFVHGVMRDSTVKWHVPVTHQDSVVELPVMGYPQPFSVGGAAAAGAKGGEGWSKASGPKKTVVVLAQGRSGSTTLQSLLNVCVNDAFIQGENDFSVWWLYKHALSTASYELYTKQSTTYAHMKTEYDEPSMPFYQKVVPEHVRSEQRALVMATIAHGKRARVVGFKEVRWLERVMQDRPPGDSFWDKDDRRGALRGYRTGNTTQRLAHFFRWLGGVVPDLHVVVLTRDPAGQSKSAWFAQNPNAASEIARGNAVFEQTRREPGMPRSFHITHDDLVNKDMRRLARLFGFLSEPFKEKCVRDELEKKHSWRS